MDDNKLGFSELYDVQLKASYPLVINGIKIDVGEPLAAFQSIQVSTIEEFKERKDAQGGYHNTPRVSWDTTKEINLNFSQGVMTKTHLALLGNSDSEKVDDIIVPKTELLETDENNMITLQGTPIVKSLFIYNFNGGEKITDYTVNDNTVIFGSSITPYTDLSICYDYIYHGDINIISVGRQLINGYLELSGKTRLKDDKTGQTYTGIFIIPRLKLMSDLSIRLGKDVSPVVANFKTTGYPIGSKGNERVMELIILDSDIDK